MLAHALVSKQADHTPLYRLSQIYARQGVDLGRSTLADWAGAAAALLSTWRKPLAVKTHADDTLIRVPGGQGQGTRQALGLCKTRRAALLLLVGPRKRERFALAPAPAALLGKHWRIETVIGRLKVRCGLVQLCSCRGLPVLKTLGLSALLLYTLIWERARA